MTEAQQKLQYNKTYQELNLLGRGAYGSAFLVRNKTDDSFYVAKKMMLEGMSQKDMASAWGEVNLCHIFSQIEILKKFNQMSIPFIVEYKESYNFQNNLIIVMEYCEHGDLQTFLKNWKKKGEPLDERVVVNWFIQLLFGVKALHSKNVLHRDLKSANVFLTSNKTLKIGDFGISKVLDNTSAKTFVGTPYYLSPQVCENRPYNLSSDLWSLGCIIYEMCTLTYPFQASNLLGLAMKILTDEVKPLPSEYSRELNNIVMKLFIKNEKQRITIDEILKMPFIKKHMATFVQDQQKINKLIVIGKKQIKVQQQEVEQSNDNKNGASTKKGTLKTADNSNDETMKTINSVMQNTGKNKETMTLSYSQSLTPAQRLKLKKQQQALKQQQRIKEELQKNESYRNFAKQRKCQNLASSNGTTLLSINKNTQYLGNSFNKSFALEKQIQHQNRQKAELKMAKQRLQKMQFINTQELSTSINQLMTRKGTTQNNNIKTFNNDISFEQIPLPGDTIKTITKTMKNTYLDERPIKPSKNQKYEVIDEEIDDYSYYNSYGHEEDEGLEQYYDDEFQDYVEDEGQTTIGKSTATREQFEDIKAFYENEMGHSDISPTKKSKIIKAFKNEEISLPSNKQQRVLHKIQKCKQVIGEKRYNELYKKMKTMKIDYRTIKKNFSPEEINILHVIEEILYEEEK